MIKFSKDKVLLLHRLIAQETGGSIGVRDEALLDSALENAFAGFDGQEFYPTKEEKGARLGYTLISNHAFVDGNKRIGMYVMLTFLEVNGITYLILCFWAKSAINPIWSFCTAPMIKLAFDNASSFNISLTFFVPFPVSYTDSSIEVPIYRKLSTANSNPS